MTTLALDLGQSVGWVKGSIIGPMTYGTFPMVKSTQLGKWVRGSDAFFRDVLPGVTAIAVEQPFLGDDYFPARKLISLLGHVHYWADWHGITNVKEIAISSGKSNLAGYGRADADQMIASAKARYALDLDEHQAHALGIWDYWQFGKREPIAKPKTRSGKGTVVKP